MAPPPASGPTPHKVESHAETKSEFDGAARENNTLGRIGMAADIAIVALHPDLTPLHDVR